VLFRSKAILDQLPEVERQAKSMTGRLDHSRIAAAGHSFGGHTAGLLLGARVSGTDFSDPRITAGILLAAPGRGGRDLTEESAARFPFFDVDFSTLKTRTLVVCGDTDDPHFTDRGPEWHADAFHDAPGAHALLMMRGVGHGLGGIAGLDAKETEIEAPDVLEATKRLTLAWLRMALALDDHGWNAACDALEGIAAPLATAAGKPPRARIEPGKAGA
jgi:predicted dienelactone hydrolase